MRTLFSVAFALVCGLLMTRPFSKFRLPDVTAYLVAGLLIGPSLIGKLNIPFLGFNTTEMVDNISILSDVALGFIAFSIGSEFRADALKKTGRQAVVIGILQAITATLIVDVALLIFHFIFPEVLSIPAVITLGAIAAATAPAATLMVVRQYKAKGEVTSLLLPIVALDDAVGLVVFAISFGAARAIVDGKASIFIILAEPFIEIVLSLLVGTIAGWLLTQLEKLFHSNTNRLAMTVAFVLLTVAISMMEWEVGSIRVGFSSLLVCMMLGTVFANICPLSEDLMNRADKWTAPLMVLFFVASGAGLDLSVMSSGLVILAGVIYILARCVGKYFGASYSAKLTNCSPTVIKYLGITLFPQAGVALGMCVTARTLGTEGELIRSIVLFAVLVYEIFGPLMTKWALTKSGDIQPVSDEVKNRRETMLAEAAAKKQQ